MHFSMAERGQKGAREPLGNCQASEHGAPPCFSWTGQDSFPHILRRPPGTKKCDNGKETSPKQHEGSGVGAEMAFGEFSP